jgi:mercuric ion transport protein
MTVQDDIASSAQDRPAAAERTMRGATLLSIGGILAGLAAASCCVVPFLLFLAGISGAWIGSLTALEPYRPYFSAAAIACISYGFYRVYRKPATACATGTYCAQPSRGRVTKIALWSAVAIVALALGSPYVIAYWL